MIELIRSILLAFATLISGSGLGPIFDIIPPFITTLFDYKITRYIVLVLMLWQSGQSIILSVVMVAVFIGIMYGISMFENEFLLNMLKLKETTAVIETPLTETSDILPEMTTENIPAYMRSVTAEPEPAITDEITDIEQIPIEPIADEANNVEGFTNWAKVDFIR